MKLFKIAFSSYLFITSLAVLSQDAVVSKIPEHPAKIIKIGLLLQDVKSDQARDGAEMAVLKANEKQKINGRTFQLVTRSMEGSWGTGSKVAVDLIFNEGVCAIVGSHDGRNAHLVEQVAAKAQVVFLSAWASDPTLSQAFVPWFFNVVPNDLQQGMALCDEIYTKRKISKIATISNPGYDSKLALKNFLKILKNTGNADPLQFLADNSLNDFSVLLDQISKTDIKGIVLFGSAGASKKLIQQLRFRHMNQQVFCSLSALGEDDFVGYNLKNLEDVVLISSANYSTSEGFTFQNEFLKNYRQLPGAAAAFAYDGVNLIIESIQNSGTEREAIQKALAGIHFKGITGSIQFDKRGNRNSAVNLVAIKNGIPLAGGK